jgi:syntaxin 16
MRDVNIRQISLSAIIQFRTAMQAPTSSYVEPTTRSRTLLFLSYRDSSSTRIRRRPRAGPKPPSYYSDTPNYAEGGSERQGLINGAEDMAGHTTIDMDSLPPKWCANLSIRRSFLLQLRKSVIVLTLSFRRVDISEQVEDILAGTQVKGMLISVIWALIRRLLIVMFAVSSLEKLHAKHVLPGFTDRSAEEREIEMMTTDITRVRVATPYRPPFILILLQVKLTTWRF